MTHAAVPVLAREPSLREWVAKVAACRYDPRDVPVAGKHGVTLGMGMTEKQGGSDVRANTTTATPQADGGYVLRGHKWFFSAPMSDGFLVLAQAPGGLTCFLLPRRLPDGTLNGFRLMRLKDKLGDWSNASSEIEFDAARAHRIGEEGRGVVTIIQMVMLTRLDCMLGSSADAHGAGAGAPPRATAVRSGRLVEHPPMANVGRPGTGGGGRDCAVDAVARAVDAAPRDEPKRRSPGLPPRSASTDLPPRAGLRQRGAGVPGGNGYGGIDPAAAVPAGAAEPIWEGSGNIQCLDAARAGARPPAARRWPSSARLMGWTGA